MKITIFGLFSVGFILSTILISRIFTDFQEPSLR